MKTFIQKTIIFLLVSTFSVLALVIFTNYIVKQNANFKFNEKNTKLILGHSHSAYALNDSLLKNTINLSASGESYFYNYQKLRKLVDNNKQINTLFLEFANNQIDSTMDSWIWGFDKMSAKIKYYSPFLDQEDFNLLLDNNSSDLFASYSIATRKQLYRVLGQNFDFIRDIGGYSYSDITKVEDMIRNDDFNYSISKTLALSEKNISYLRKIVDFSTKNNIKIYLIRSPQHPQYADLVNESIYKNVLNTKFKDVEFLDFDAMYFPNNNYLDLHHLNATGAKKFSIFFNDLIENKGLLNTLNKQELIDKEIKVFNNNYLSN
ncbi:hypothetical protein [Winogradskyella endarachnes]|uniref:Uncharacterized protein n=1 Tax=Winogradskyella endarachnes TaxID=2681965 RepID=A0A6L6U538_9FLAO|nr:hypothetical protein [Winogradskyella endarachnes]MUU77210.1 hypothetical protein [Winogradskyella endarachnes]